MSYRWAVLAAGTTAQAAFSTVSFAIAVLAPALRDKYDLSLTQIGIVLAAEWVGLTVALLPWGFAVDRFGERWTLAGGLAGCSGFLVASAYAPTFGWFVTFLGLAGIAGGSVQSGSGRAVMRWFAARERGLALGVRQTAVPIGGAVAAFVLPLSSSAARSWAPSCCAPARRSTSRRGTSRSRSGTAGSGSPAGAAASTSSHRWR